MKNEPIEDRRAAIVCSHVAEGLAPILRAVRDEPEFEEDSGWQFRCGDVDDGDSDNAKVWLVCEIIDEEPSLRDYLGEPPGTVITRKNKQDSWLVSYKK